VSDKIGEESSVVYFLSPTTLRDMKLERHRKTRDKCFESHSEFKGRPKEETLRERQKKWDKLRDSIETKGFDPKQPIKIMLNRKDGNRDQVFQGHHRLAIAIELHLPEIPVRFVTKKK